MIIQHYYFCVVSIYILLKYFCFILYSKKKYTEMIRRNRIINLFDSYFVSLFEKLKLYRYKGYKTHSEKNPTIKIISSDS